MASSDVGRPIALGHGSRRAAHRTALPNGGDHGPVLAPDGHLGSSLGSPLGGWMVVMPHRSVILAAAYDDAPQAGVQASCMRVNDLDSVGQN